MQQILSDWIIPDLANIISEYADVARILVVGNNGSGKSALLDFLNEEKFNRNYNYQASCLPVYVGKTMFVETRGFDDIGEEDRVVIVIDASYRFGYTTLNEYLKKYKSAKKITVLVNKCDDLPAPRVVVKDKSSIMIRTHLFETPVFSKKVDKIVYFSCKNRTVIPQQFVEMLG